METFSELLRRLDAAGKLLAVIVEAPSPNGHPPGLISKFEPVGDEAKAELEKFLESHPGFEGVYRQVIVTPTDKRFEPKS